MAQLVKEWQARAEQLKALNLKQIEGPLGELDAHLTLRTYIVGHSLTDADVTVWKTLRDNRVAHAYIKQGLMVNLTRWFRFIDDTNPSFTLPQHPAKAAKSNEEGNTIRDDGSNYDIGLQDTDKGVVTRFPPEPSYVVTKSRPLDLTPVPDLRTGVVGLTSIQGLSAHWSRQSRFTERFFRSQEVPWNPYTAI